MNGLCIIPARGGSKRIPQKNSKPFLGRPIIHYSIEAAKNCALFDTVMVSTDDVHIAAVAAAAGAEVPFMRSAATATDEATTAAVLIEVLNRYAEKGMKPEYACCFYATAPFVTPALLQEAFTLFREKNYDTVFPIVAFDYPIQRSLWLRNGRVTMREPEHKNTRSQELETAYHDTGLFYFFKPETLLRTGHLWDGETGGVVLNPLLAQDIDTEADWEAAEWKFRFLQEKGLH